MMINYKKIGWFIFIAGVIILAILLLQPGRDKDQVSPPAPEENQYQTAEKSSMPSEKMTFSADDFFAEYRVERERVRGRQIEMLREVLNSPAMKEAQPQAALQLIDISAKMEKELQTEGMIKSKGFTDCVAIIQAETALIVIQSGRPVQQQEDEVMATVEKITGYDVDRICIIYREK
ncbi:MAG: SpoIIIAH-like family protein [Syntrophomonadaceae bacterium]|nr:SpoIIIAH-like family protein [Syntrophomonadaceae bacterium]